MSQFIIKNYKNFYKNKKVIVTGHTGFKGSWLALWLSSMGANVIGISNNIPTNPSHFQKLKLKKKIKSIKCDIRNIKKLKKIIFNFKPDIIFHLAAQAIVKESYISPYKTWQTNLLGSINILEAIKDYSFSKIICVLITSDKVYKNIETKKGYLELDKLGGEDPYSASKAAADIAITSYFKSYISKKNKNFIAIARAGNVIGGGDWSAGRLIPDCVKAWSQKKKVIIRNINSTRPWQHVLEVLNGYLMLAYSLSKNSKINGEAFNFGPKMSLKYRVIDVLKTAKLNWSEASWKVVKTISFKESKLLHLNIEKARKKIKWKNYLSFQETIKLTIEWYKNFYKKKKNIYNFSLNQIINYQKTLKKR